MQIFYENLVLEVSDNINIDLAENWIKVNVCEDVAQFWNPQGIPCIHIGDPLQGTKVLMVFLDYADGTVFPRTCTEENNPVDNLAMFI